MDTQSKPRVILYGYSNYDQSMLFVGFNGLIKISGYQKEILSILPYCNGHDSVEEISLKLKELQPELIYALIEYLVNQGILCDSRNLQTIFHSQTLNPPKYFQNLTFEEVAKLTQDATFANSYDIGSNIMKLPEVKTHLLNLLSERRTIRDFDDSCLTFEDLSGLIQVTTSVDKNPSIPHAGGINPFKVYIVSTGNNDLQKGVYMVSQIENSLKFQSNINLDLLRTALDTELLLPKHGIVIFITADITLQAKKYANRGYRYSLIGAGHIAQNVQLYCTENLLNAIEYGGFDDSLCANILDLDGTDNVVLISIIVGKRSNAITTINDIALLEQQQQVSALKLRYYGENKVVESFSTFTIAQPDYVFPKIAFLGKYGITNDDQDELRVGNSFATANSHNLALIKGFAEAIERYYSGELRVDCISKAINLNGKWLNPHSVTPWHEHMFESNALTRFDENIVLEWTKGENLKTQENIWVLVENAFYPLYNNKVINRKLCTECNSSGVAAHFKKDLAIQSALLELIERDALMVTWFSERNVRAISVSLAPNSIQERSSHWLSKGFQVKFLDITLDSIPVVLCLIFNRSGKPCLLAGASAQFDYDTAIEKSFEEAEFQLVTWDDSSAPIDDLFSIRVPADHALYYADPLRLNNVEWLLNADEMFELPEIENTDILNLFDPILVVLKEPIDTMDLWVVRIIEENLFPINFGYRFEHFGHQRLKNLGLKWMKQYPSIPHFFA